MLKVVVLTIFLAGIQGLHFAPKNAESVSVKKREEKLGDLLVILDNKISTLYDMEKKDPTPGGYFPRFQASKKEVGEVMSEIDAKLSGLSDFEASSDFMTSLTKAVSYVKMLFDEAGGLAAYDVSKLLLAKEAATALKETFEKGPEKSVLQEIAELNKVYYLWSDTPPEVEDAIIMAEADGWDKDHRKLEGKLLAIVDLMKEVMDDGWTPTDEFIEEMVEARKKLEGEDEEFLKLMRYSRADDKEVTFLKTAAMKVKWDAEEDYSLAAKRFETHKEEVYEVTDPLKNGLKDYDATDEVKARGKLKEEMAAAILKVKTKWLADKNALLDVNDKFKLKFGGKSLLETDEIANPLVGLGKITLAEAVSAEDTWEIIEGAIAALDDYSSKVTKYASMVSADVPDVNVFLNDEFDAARATLTSEAAAKTILTTEKEREILFGTIEEPSDMEKLKAQLVSVCNNWKLSSTVSRLVSETAMVLPKDIIHRVPTPPICFDLPMIKVTGFKLKFFAKRNLKKACYEMMPHGLNYVKDPTELKILNDVCKDALGCSSDYAKKVAEKKTEVAEQEKTVDAIIAGIEGLSKEIECMLLGGCKKKAEKAPYVAASKKTEADLEDPAMEQLVERLILTYGLEKLMNIPEFDENQEFSDGGEAECKFKAVDLLSTHDEMEGALEVMVSMFPAIKKETVPVDYIKVMKGVYEKELIDQLTGKKAQGLEMGKPADVKAVAKEFGLLDAINKEEQSTVKPIVMLQDKESMRRLSWASQAAEFDAAAGKAAAKLRTIIDLSKLTNLDLAQFSAKVTEMYDDTRQKLAGLAACAQKYVATKNEMSDIEAAKVNEKMLKEELQALRLKFLLRDFEPAGIDELEEELVESYKLSYEYYTRELGLWSEEAPSLAPMSIISKKVAELEEKSKDATTVAKVKEAGAWLAENVEEDGSLKMDLRAMEFRMLKKVNDLESAYDKDGQTMGQVLDALIKLYEGLQNEGVTTVEKQLEDDLAQAKDSLSKVVAAKLKGLKVEVEEAAIESKDKKFGAEKELKELGAEDLAELDKLQDIKTKFKLPDKDFENKEEVDFYVGEASKIPYLESIVGLYTKMVEGSLDAAKIFANLAEEISAMRNKLAKMVWIKSHLAESESAKIRDKELMLELVEQKAAEYEKEAEELVIKGKGSKEELLEEVVETKAMLMKNLDLMVDERVKGKWLAQVWDKFVEFEDLDEWEEGKGAKDKFIDDLFAVKRTTRITSFDDLAKAQKEKEAMIKDAYISGAAPKSKYIEDFKARLNPVKRKEEEEEQLTQLLGFKPYVPKGKDEEGKLALDTMIWKLQDKIRELVKGKFKKFILDHPQVPIQEPQIMLVKQVTEEFMVRFELMFDDPDTHRFMDELAGIRKKGKGREGDAVIQAMENTIALRTAVVMESYPTLKLLGEIVESVEKKVDNLLIEQAASED